MTELVVRRPTIDHLDAVVELGNAFERVFADVESFTREDLADEWRQADLERDAWLVDVDRGLGGSRYDPSLWAGDEIAGGAICEAGVYEMGWVRSLWVRRPWRKRGLGNALLLDAFRRFHERGERRVGLGVDPQSPTGATMLYERAGMRVAEESVVHRKELA